MGSFFSFTKLIVLVIVLAPSWAVAQPPPVAPAPATQAPPAPAPSVPAPQNPSTPLTVQTPSPAEPPAAAPTLSSEEISTMLALLERIDSVVAEARGESNPTKVVGTSGTSAGSVKVTMEAAELDEIRAEISQLKKMLQTIQPPKQ
jgi:hypothetical protein